MSLNFTSLTLQQVIFEDHRFILIEICPSKRVILLEYPQSASLSHRMWSRLRVKCFIYWLVVNDKYSLPNHKSLFFCQKNSKNHQPWRGPIRVIETTDYLNYFCFCLHNSIRRAIVPPSYNSMRKPVKIIRL